MKINIEKYEKSRFWKIEINDELLVVTVYKKGAEAVRDLIIKLNSKGATK